MGELPLVIAFTAGTASAVNPCGFALLPAFVSLFLGEADTDRTILGRLGRATSVAGLVTVGFVIVFATLGTVISLGSSSFVRLVPWVALAVGVGLIAMGSALLGGRSFGVSVHAISRVGGRSNRSMVTYGMAYGLASAGCTLPVFLVVVAAALSGQGLVGGISVFVAYALGMGAVLLAVTVATAVGKSAVVRALRRVAPHLELVSGLGLLVAGGYLVYREIAFLRFIGWA